VWEDSVPIRSSATQKLHHNSQESTSQLPRPGNSCPHCNVSSGHAHIHYNVATGTGDRTQWSAPPSIPVRTVCTSSQATPAYSEYYSHTHTWLPRSSYSTVLWACVSQLASDLTHLFGHFIALIMRSCICITKHTQSLPSSLRQHLRLLMPTDKAHLCLLIAY
jgi:hypothetical protein